MTIGHYNKRKEKREQVIASVFFAYLTLYSFNSIMETKGEIE